MQTLGSWWPGPDGAAPAFAVALRQKVPAHSPPLDPATLEPDFFGAGEPGTDIGLMRTGTHRAHHLFGTDERQMQELQFEFFVDVKHAEVAMRATQAATKDWHLPPACDPTGQPTANYTDVRLIRADEQLLAATTSAGGGDTVAMAMGLNRRLADDPAELAATVGKLEAALAPFEMRPHWGKLTTWGAAEYERAYGPALAEFRRVARALDPTGKFRNRWVAEKLFGGDGGPGVGG
eukprot:SAG22_NODE_100_length_20558_cov_10.189305_19_plen_235_part_00